MFRIHFSSAGMVCLALCALGLAGCASYPPQGYSAPAYAAPPGWYYGGYYPSPYAYGAYPYSPYGYAGGWSPYYYPVIIPGNPAPVIGTNPPPPVHPASPPVIPPTFHGHAGFEKPFRPHRTKNGTTVYPP